MPRRKLSEMTLDALLELGADESTALVEPGCTTLTYAELRSVTRGLMAALLRAGVRPGDRVAASLGNCSGIVTAFFAIACARAAFAPLNPAYTGDEFRFYLEDIAPTFLLLNKATVPNARAAAQKLGIPIIDLPIRLEGQAEKAATPRARPHDADIALFLHTSGTTSRPKGVPLSHNNLVTSAMNIVRWYGLTERDVSLCIMPLFHVHGLVFSTVATLAAGGTVVIPERFSASAFWPLVRAVRATIVSAVPTIYRSLLSRAAQDDAPGPGEHPLRFMRSSSAALPASDMRSLETRFGAPVIEAYSMTEASHQMCANPLDGRRVPGSVGIGAHVDVAIMDEAGELLPPSEVGEVVVRGANVTRGYHNNPSANAAAFTNGWFRTGDSGTLDSQGYVRLVGRLKELINRGGEKISPVEIDDVLLAHPAVAEAVAFGIPDEKYGEAVAAAVVLSSSATENELREHVASRLAAFKVPTVIHLTEAIPKTATGKVQRRLVAAAFATTQS